MATAAVQRHHPQQHSQLKVEEDSDDDDKMGIAMVAAPLPQSATIRFLKQEAPQEEETKSTSATTATSTVSTTTTKLKGSLEPPPTEFEALILTGLVDLLVREVSHEVHRQVKTGLLSMAEVFGTPGRAGRDLSLVTSTTTTTTTFPSSSSSSSSSSSLCTTDGTTMPLASPPPQASAAAVPAVDDDSVDIYGRVPPKEPKYPFQCSACGRGVSVLRYAPHLDKCLGKNKMARNAGSQRKQSLGASGSGLQSLVGATDAATALAGNGVGDPAAALEAAADAMKKKKRKRNQNSHPELATYVFNSDATGGPMVLRLRVGEDGKAVRLLPPTGEAAVVRLPIVSVGGTESDKGICTAEASQSAQAPLQANMFPPPPPAQQQQLQQAQLAQPQPPPHQTLPVALQHQPQSQSTPRLQVPGVQGGMLLPCSAARSPHGMLSTHQHPFPQAFQGQLQHPATVMVARPPFVPQFPHMQQQQPQQLQQQLQQQQYSHTPQQLPAAPPGQPLPPPRPPGPNAIFPTSLPPLPIFPSPGLPNSRPSAPRGRPPKR